MVEVYPNRNSIYLGDYLLLGKGEESSNGREKESILAGTYEALIGALYIDRGLKKTTKLRKAFSKSS